MNRSISLCSQIMYVYIAQPFVAYMTIGYIAQNNYKKQFRLSDVAY